MNKSFLHDPRVVVKKQGSFKLKDHVTDIDTLMEKKDLKELLEKDKDLISDLQEVLYAASERSVLLIFQAMDAAGKDSCIRHVATRPSENH